MKNLVLVLILLAFLVMSACASGPRIRDTSHDDPRKIGEIERLVSHKASSAVLGGESKFSPRENVGWTIYRMYDKETKTTSALEAQIVPAGPGKHWLETRIVTPSNRSVTRLLVGTTGKPVGKTADGKPITKRLFRMITWNDAEKEAREYPPDFIASSNNMAGNLGALLTSVGEDQTPKKKVKVAAGVFPSCFVHTVGKIIFLREAEETCYSSLIPAPYVVLRESDSSKQELVSYGFGARRSLLPLNVKVVVDNSMGGLKIRDRSAEIREMKNKKKSTNTADNKDSVLTKFLNL